MNYDDDDVNDEDKEDDNEYFDSDEFLDDVMEEIEEAIGEDSAMAYYLMRDPSEYMIDG